LVPPVSRVFDVRIEFVHPTRRVPDPQGQFGISRLARFRLSGLGGKEVTVGERFKVLNDPWGVAGKLTPQSSPTTNGIFDDCYSIHTDKPLPPISRSR
jgi:hypothetical protein